MRRYKNAEGGRGRIDWAIFLVPIVTVVTLSVLFACFPVKSNEVLSGVRSLFGDTFGVFYLAVGLGVFLPPCSWPSPDTEPLCWEIPGRSRNFLFLPGAR